MKILLLLILVRPLGPLLAFFCYADAAVALQAYGFSLVYGVNAVPHAQPFAQVLVGEVQVFFIEAAFFCQHHALVFYQPPIALTMKSGPSQHAVQPH
jgi:hypothetical protein